MDFLLYRFIKEYQKVFARLFSRTVFFMLLLMNSYDTLIYFLANTIICSLSTLNNYVWACKTDVLDNSPSQPLPPHPP